MQFELFIQLLTILAIITLAASGVLQAAQRRLFGCSKCRCLNFGSNALFRAVILNPDFAIDQTGTDETVGTFNAYFYSPQDNKP